MESIGTDWRSGDGETDAPNEVQSLRRTLRDVVALSALPSIWVDYDLPRSLQNLTDVLRAALRAYTVCLRVKLPDGGDFKTAASTGLSTEPAHPCDTAEVLDAAEVDSTEVIELAKFNGAGPLNALAHPLFFDGHRIGHFVACYKMDFVPSQSARLLLQVAANQVVLLFQRHKDQEERFARKLAEERLRQTEHHYQQLVQSLPAAIYTCDTDARLTLYNEAAVEVWGRRPRIGQDSWFGYWKTFRPDGSPMPLDECPMAIAIREGRSVRGKEIIVERPDGTRLWMLPHPDPLRNESGEIVGFVNMLVQVDDLKRTEQELRRKTSQLAAFLETAAVGLHRVGPNGIIQWANEAELRMLGYPPEEYIGHHIAKFHADQPVIDDILKRLTCGDKLCEREARLRCKDGSIKHVLIDSSVLWEDGQFIHTQCFTRDITEKKRIEQALHLSSRLPAENPAPVLRVDRNHILHFANPKAQEFLSQWKSAIGEPAPPAIVDLLGDGQRHDSGARIGDRYYTVAVVPVLEGQFINLYFSDITERNQAEEALAESERELAVQVKDLQRLHERSVKLAGMQNLQEVFREVLQAALGVHRTDRGLLSMFDAEREMLHVVASEGFAPAFLDAVRYVPLGAGACGACFKDKKRIVVEDTETDPLFAPCRDTAKLGGFRAVHSTPLVTRDAKIIGVLSAHFAEPRRPAEREIRLMDLYARQIADIIEDARLRDELKRELTDRIEAEKNLRKRGERLQLLSETLGQLLNARNPEMTVRELFLKVAAHLGVDTYFNFMVTPEGDSLALHSFAGISEDMARSIGRLEFGQAICGTVAQTRRPLHAADIQNSDFDKAALARSFGIQCYACNPLMVGDRLLGTLSFASRTRRAFDEEELQFLQLISQYTAVALDRMKSAEELRESEERFRAVLDNSPAIIYVKDCDGRYLLINDQYSKLFHTTQEWFVGKRDLDLFPAEIAQKFRDHDARVIQTGEPLEIEEVAPQDDGLHTFISVKFPLRRSDGTIYAVAGISTDITERKRDEEKAATLAAIVEHSEDAIFSADLDGTIKTWNAGAQRLYGYRAEQAIGRLVTFLVPEDRLGEEARILDSIREGRTVENFETLRRSKDGTLFAVSLTVSPVKDVKGNVIGASKVARDITDKVRAKEKLEQTVAERTARLRDTVAELEAFSYSVAHDMRAPLRAMNSYSRLLEADFAAALPPEAKDFTRRIAASASRLDALITDVLNYSKIARSEMTLEKVDVEKLTGEIIDSYPDLHEAGATFQIQSPIPPVVANTAALTQCISNLLSNAVKFVAPGMTPRIIVRAEKKSDYVRLWFEDNGIGISEEGQKRIFRLFQRLNPAAQFEGTGIGLTIVRKAVERMGGKVGVQSRLGAGSQFWIELQGA